MNDWFEWNGVRCTEYGIHVTEQPSIIRPSERVTFTNVPGRNGALTTLEGDDVYDDFILPISCTISDISRLPDICAWLKGAGTLKLAARLGGFYYARLANQIELTKVLRNHKNRVFTLNFRCKPFWYFDPEADKQIQPSAGSTSGYVTMTNPGNVASEPIITVTGSGEITLIVGMSIVELSDITDSITIDSTLQEAYSGYTSMNNCMSGDFPLLPPGSSTISWTGNVSFLTVTPNWRTLG